MGRSSLPSLLIGVASAAAITGAAWLVHRVQTLDTRLSVAEGRLADLEPLRSVVSRSRGLPAPAGKPYSAAQATGPADVAEPGRDDPRAWCPAAPDERDAWLELGYGVAAPARAIRIHASFNPGGIVRVTGSAAGARAAVLWEGKTPAESIHEIRLEPAVPLDTVRLHFNLHEDAAWREIDAVALVSPDGSVRWATTAAASSEWETRP